MGGSRAPGNVTHASISTGMATTQNIPTSAIGGVGDVQGRSARSAAVTGTSKTRLPRPIPGGGEGKGWAARTDVRQARSNVGWPLERTRRTKRTIPDSSRPNMTRVIPDPGGADGARAARWAQTRRLNSMSGSAGGLLTTVGLGVVGRGAADLRDGEGRGAEAAIGAGVISADAVGPFDCAFGADTWRAADTGLRSRAWGGARAADDGGWGGASTKLTIIACSDASAGAGL